MTFVDNKTKYDLSTENLMYTQLVLQLFGNKLETYI